LTQYIFECSYCGQTVVGDTEREASGRLVKHDCFGIKGARDMTLDQLLRALYKLQQDREI
jgi:hypothetical protein